MGKEFEKFWEYYCRNDLTLREKHWGKTGWKQALKWLYEKLDHSEEHKELKDIIMEELEN